MGDGGWEIGDGGWRLGDGGSTCHSVGLQSLEQDLPHPRLPHRGQPFRNHKMVPQVPHRLLLPPQGRLQPRGLHPLLQQQTYGLDDSPTTSTGERGRGVEGAKDGGGYQGMGRGEEGD